MAVSRNHVTVVIPTKNERQAIGTVLQELRRHGYDQILVVDAYSTDKTANIAEQIGAKVIHQHGWGKGKAIQTAVEHVSTPYMLVMDGDYTYDPKHIDEFLFHADNYDYIIGARMNGRKNIPAMNRFGNWLINKTFNALFGGGIKDVCSGMYLLRTKAAKGLQLDSRGFDVEVEIAAQMALEGKITELPISYRKRIGKKKLSSWKDGFRILMNLLKLARAYNPVFFFSTLCSMAFIPALLILSWVFLEAMLSGTWHSGLAMMGLVLLLLAVQALTVGTISVLLKRFEHRLSRRLEG